MAEKASSTPPSAPATTETEKTLYKRIQYAVVGREELQFKLGPNKKKGEFDKDEVDERFNPNIIPGVRSFVYCRGDGSVLAVLTAGGFQVFDTDSGQVLCNVEHPGVQRMTLSPMGNFALTWEKHNANAEVGNVKVWRVKDGSKEVVFHAAEKNLLETKWPLVKWSEDESVAAYMVKNVIQVYNGKEFGRFDKVKCQGVTQFSLKTNGNPASEEHPCKIAAFVPEVKGSPARINLFNYVPGNNSEAAIGGKTFFKAQEATFRWSPAGDAVLVKTDTDIDTTGQSYYGQSALYLLHSNGQYDVKLTPEKDGGSFHDFAWSPQGKHFVAISGKSLSASILYNFKGDAVYDFGTAHRNTIRFSPHGRFLCLGGFGNLSGDMDFWDVNKRAKMGSVTANCAVTQEWSPCGRFFMTSTLFPRMRVDNGVTFYTYRGELLYTVKVNEATQAEWRPAATGIYSDRPQTPIKGGKKAAVQTSPKKQVYRPPGMKSSSLSDQLRKQREKKNAPRALVPGSTTPGDTSKPQKSKAALRRERKKKAEAAKKAAAAGGE